MTTGTCAANPKLDFKKALTHVVYIYIYILHVCSNNNYTILILRFIEQCYLIAVQYLCMLWWMKQCHFRCLKQFKFFYTLWTNSLMDKVDVSKLTLYLDMPKVTWHIIQPYDQITSRNVGTLLKQVGCYQHVMVTSAEILNHFVLLVGVHIWKGWKKKNILQVALNVIWRIYTG